MMRSQDLVERAMRRVEIRSGRLEDHRDECEIGCSGLRVSDDGSVRGGCPTCRKLSKPLIRSADEALRVINRAHLPDVNGACD